MTWMSWKWVRWINPEDGKKPFAAQTRLIAAKAAYSAHALSGFQVSNFNDCAGLAQELLFPGRP